MSASSPTSRAARLALTPRLLARSARHGADELALRAALPLAPREGVVAPIHHPLREAVCGPSLVLVALSALSEARRAREDADSSPVAVLSATPGNVHLRLLCEALGDHSVRLALEVENCTSHPLALSFGSSQRFDFWATREGDETPLWRWSSGRRFAPQPEALRLDAASSLRFEANWNDVPPGLWRLGGKITAHGAFEAEAVEMRVG